MTGIRNRSAWVWVAIAAVAFASVSRAEAGLQGAKAYAHPVLQFLARSQTQHAIPGPGASRHAQRGSSHPMRAIFSDTISGSWLAMLPVFFIGLIAPLALESAPSPNSLGRWPAQPLLPASFQRPPPCLA
jgi:hypothetical protein